MGITSGQGRVSQPEYWLYFAIYMMLSIGSLISIFYFAAQLRISLTLFSAFVLFVGGLWFRVVEMWRCRDVGWPAAIPWLIFAAQFLFGLIGGVSALSMVAMLIATLILGFIDFVFAVGIGFLPTQEVRQVDPSNYTPIDYSGFKKPDGRQAVSDLNETAMARIEKAQAPKAAAVAIAPAAVIAPQRAGFGRKGL